MPILYVTRRDAIKAKITKQPVVVVVVDQVRRENGLDDWLKKQEASLPLDAKIMVLRSVYRLFLGANSSPSWWYRKDAGSNRHGS